MNTKKFLLPSIFLAITIVAYIAASLIFCYTTKPLVETGEFPFSITYEYKGETNTLSGVYKCKFSGSSTIYDMHDRYWEGESIIPYDGEYDIPNIIESTDTMSVAIFENMDAGYFMGDPLYKEWYASYGLEGPEPRVDYHDYENEIHIDFENDEEVLAEIGLKILDYTYAEPIENSFSFSGVMYEADNVPIFVLISLVFLVLCLIFVRKDKEYKYTYLDKSGIILNFIIGIVALPFITLICWLFGIFGGGDILSQIIYSTPSIAIVCLALSVVLRRKGVSKTGFFIQFVGIAMFSAFIIIDAI